LIEGVLFDKPHRDLRKLGNVLKARNMTILNARGSAIPITPLPKGTLQDHVYRQLCEMILSGEIVPGQLVTIQALSDAFGVSAMPVREALQRLTAAKVLTVISSRSIGIPLLTIERLLDLKRVRLEIESLAAEWAVGRMRTTELSKLKVLVGQMETAAAGDRKDYVRSNREFHFAIYRAADSDVLYAIIENLWLQISPYFHLLHDSGNFRTSNTQHKLILRGLKARDSVAVKEGIRNDIEAASRVLLELLDAPAK
jgi:DNA-binding GntR family transcriptional regulator